MKGFDRPRITPAVLFILTAVASFPVTAGFVALAAPQLAAGQFRTMPVLAANHLLTLGWGTMVALGALNQLLPAAAGLPQANDRSALVQFAFYLPGVFTLVSGFWTRNTLMLMVGASAIVFPVLVHLTGSLAILRRRRRWLPVMDYVTAALLSLAGVTLWGLLLATNWRFAFWPYLLRVEGLLVHLVLGLAGWFGLLTIGVSYYLLPRFAGQDARVRSREVLMTMGAGIVLTISSAVPGSALRSVGWLLLAFGGILYSLDLWNVLIAWRPRSRDITRAHWRIIQLETLALSLGLAAGGLGVLHDTARWTAAGVALFLLGWVTLAITGQAYKVTPFLMWHYRFALGIRAVDVPRLESPYWPKWGVPALVLLAIGGPLVALATVAGLRWLAIAGGTSYFAGACVFSGLMGYSWLARVPRR